MITLRDIEQRADTERSIIEWLNIIRINYCYYLDWQWFIDSFKSSLLLKYHTLGLAGASFIIDLFEFFSLEVEVLLFSSDVLNLWLDFLGELWNDIIGIVDMIVELNH
jgi:hypothetical protein